MKNSTKLLFVRMGLRMFYFLIFAMMIINGFLLSFDQIKLAKWEVIFLFGMFVVSYFLRMYATRIWIMAPIHIAIAVVIYFLPMLLITRIVLIGTELIMMRQATVHFLKGNHLKERPDIPWPTFVAAFVIFGTGVYLNNMEIIQISYRYPLALLLIYFMMLYVDGVDIYIKSTRDTSGIPMRRILSLNSSMVLGLFVIGIFLVFMANGVGLDAVIRQFFMAIVSLFKLAIMAVLWVVKALSGLVRENEVAEEAAMEQAELLMETMQEESPIAAILDMVLWTIGIVAASIVLYRISTALIRLVMKGRRGDEGYIVEEIQKEKKRPDKKERIRKESFLESLKKRNDPIEKARRIYKKRVDSFKKTYVPKRNETTSDIEKNLRDLVETGLPELTALYDGIRYGTVIPDAAYLEKMKRADKDPLSSE